MPTEDTNDEKDKNKVNIEGNASNIGDDSIGVGSNSEGEPAEIKTVSGKGAKKTGVNEITLDIPIQVQTPTKSSGGLLTRLGKSKAGKWMKGAALASQIGSATPDFSQLQPPTNNAVTDAEEENNEEEPNEAELAENESAEEVDNVASENIPDENKPPEPPTIPQPDREAGAEPTTETTPEEGQTEENEKIAPTDKTTETTPSTESAPPSEAQPGEQTPTPTDNEKTTPPEPPTISEEEAGEEQPGASTDEETPTEGDTTAESPQTETSTGGDTTEESTNQNPPAGEKNYEPPPASPEGETGGQLNAGANQQAAPSPAISDEEDQGGVASKLKQMQNMAVEQAATKSIMAGMKAAAAVPVLGEITMTVAVITKFCKKILGEKAAHIFVSWSIIAIIFDIICSLILPGIGYILAIPLSILLLLPVWIIYESEVEVPFLSSITAKIGGGPNFTANLKNVLRLITDGVSQSVAPEMPKMKGVEKTTGAGKK